MAKKPMSDTQKHRRANARGMDRAALADAKSGAALKSMSDRFDNPKGKNAGLTLSQALGRRAQEVNLFNDSIKLRQERNAVRNQTKRDVGDVSRRRSGGMVKKGKK